MAGHTWELKNLTTVLTVLNINIEELCESWNLLLTWLGLSPFLLSSHFKDLVRHGPFWQHYQKKIIHSSGHRIQG